jgi:hypothetical protein
MRAVVGPHHDCAMKHGLDEAMISPTRFNGQRDAGRMKWKAWSLMGLSLVLAAWSFGLLYEGFIADHYSGLFSFPFIDKSAAEGAEQRLAANALITERERAAQRLVQADPTNPDSWAAVSYAEFLKAGAMSPKAIEALDHSYAVSFFDRPGAVWRIGFAMENWSALPPALRQDVLTEAKAALDDPTLGPRLRSRLANLRDPAGRLAAMMLLTQP